MDLKDLVARWLRDEFPNWEITRELNSWKGEELRWIRFKPLRREQVWLFQDRIEFDDDRAVTKRLVIYAHDTRFFELLWNRLHTMEQGFQRAMASRDSHRPESR